MNKFLHYIKSIKQNLYSLDRKAPLNKLSIFFLILLDLLLIVLVLDGADTASRGAKLPYSKVSNQCQIFYQDFKNLELSKKLIEIQKYIESRNIEYLKVSFIADNTYSIDDNRPQTQAAASECQEAAEKLASLNTDLKIIARNDQIKEINSRIESIESQISQLEKNYQTALLEKMAKQTKEQSILEVSAVQTKSKIEAQKKLLVELNMTRSDLIKDFFNQDSIKAIDQLSQTEVAQIFSQHQKQYSHELLLYPINKMLRSLIFLGPLLLIAFWWRKKSMQKASDIQSLAANHFALITIVPIIFKIFSFAYDYLPITFFSEFHEFLLSLNIAYFWNYILIVFSIIIFILIFKSLHFFQNKSTHQIVKVKKYHIHLKCPECHSILFNHQARFCHNCGFKLKKECAHCHQENLFLNQFCDHCGEKQENM